MKLIEATKSSKRFYFKVYVNDKAPKGDEPIYEEFSWSLGRKDPSTREVVSPNDPDELIEEIKRLLSIKYGVLEKGKTLPQKGMVL